MLNQMIQQNLHTDQDQHHAAGDLRLFLKAVAKAIADPDTAERQHQRDTTNDGNGTPDLHVQTGKRDPHRQSIDRGAIASMNSSF